MKNKLLAMVLAAVIQVAVLSGSASAVAVSFPDWDNPAELSKVFVVDGQDHNNAWDISKAWHATDGEFHYFRMDLVQAPGITQYAGIYGIYIDALPGGSPAGFTYVPNQEGIDYALDSHYGPNEAPQGGQGFIQHDFHHWNNNSQVMDKLGTLDNLQTGATLEWAISVDAIGSSFTWFAATHDYVGNIIQLTWDRTNIAASAPAPVPAPSAGLLFASALLGLSLARRKS
ncbi:MAG: hypothetical protein M0T82_01525 [Desulfobacteraceae bacterium]|nr:hypothetical protein [Desulfobacteraceae bacterium]